MQLETYSQVIFNAKRAHPVEALITWKPDVSSAFLNLPAIQFISSDKLSVLKVSGACLLGVGFWLVLVLCTFGMWLP